MKRVTNNHQIDLPNGANEEIIKKKIRDHLTELKEKGIET